MNKKRKDQTSPRHQIPAVVRTSQVLRALAEREGPATSAGLAREIGISQSSCYRILQTLEGLQWIRSDGEGGYDLDEGLLAIVRPLLGPERLAEAARPILRTLSMETELTAKLSLRRGGEQVTIARIESPRPLAVTGRVGSRYPVVLGASGAALLSLMDDSAVQRIIAATPADQWLNESPDILRRHIAECRRKGVCTNIGHHPQGIDTMAAPLRSDVGEAAITLIGLRGDFEGKRLTLCTRAVKKAARAVGGE